MPSRRYPTLRVCRVTWPLSPLRLQVRIGALVAASGASPRRGGGGRTLVNGWAIASSGSQSTCCTHHARGSCGLVHRGPALPSGTAVPRRAQDGRQGRGGWRLGTLHVSKNLLLLERSTPLLWIALLAGCGTSMRRQIPARAATSLREAVTVSSRSTIPGRGRRRSAHPSPRRCNNQHAVHAAGTQKVTALVPICPGCKPIALAVRPQHAATPAVYGTTHQAFLCFPKSCTEKLYAIGYVSL
jgi:hypothetical protein